MTGCQCHGPGFCERHHVRKSPHLWKLCQTSEAYFRAWEQGRGPGQNIGGVSQQATAGSAGVGTELKKMLGCGCKFDFARLDEWGPERCLELLESIVADLVAAGERHRHPLTEAAAGRLLRLAIERCAQAVTCSQSEESVYGS